MFSRYTYARCPVRSSSTSEDAEALALVLAGVVHAPEFRALVLRVQRCCAERKEKIRSFGAALLLVAPGPPKAASKPYLSSACFSDTVFMMSVCTPSRG